MKKTILALALAAATSTSFAANYVSFDVDQVKDTRNKSENTAQYFRAGKDMGGLNWDLQVRTAVFDSGGMLNSVEVTAGKNIAGVNAFGGVGYDNGFNGKVNGDFTYGLVGVRAGVPIGPLYTFTGVKTRVNWDDSNPKQTVAWAGVSMPLTKTVSVSASMSRSLQDIEEKAVGFGLRLSY
ncbi:MAG: hypothetical protein EBR30_03365 [Cytophagia bacterium]|nr:hypothetical protein [Cytophagia bacterium]